MKLPAIAATALLALCCSCVTEDPLPDARDTSQRQTPVEEVHESVRARIARVERSSGNTLLKELQALIAYKELARAPILEVIDDVDVRTRANLLYVLGFIGGTETYQVLTRYVSDPDPVVRYESAAALLNMGDWSGIPVLIEFMDSPDRRMRYKAEAVLKETTKKDFGYSFNAPAPERERAVGMWKSWWQDQRREMIYGQ
jgi:HEAT repeat protein